VIEDSDVDQGERFAKALSDELVGMVRFRDSAARVIVSEDYGRCVVA
jgi:hypothetical protein